VTARSELPELPPAFGVREARAAGVSRGRLRASDLDRLFRGGRSHGVDRLHALAALMRPDQAFCGPTAALIHGLPLAARWERDQPLHVVGLGGARMRRPGVVGSRASSGRRVLVDGLPVLDPVSTWVTLAGLLTLDDLVAAGDRLVTGDRGRAPLASIEDLASTAHAASGRRGARSLRTAADLVRVGAWSRPETLLRLRIVRGGLPEPELNRLVRLGSGEFARPDLAWLRPRVAIEYDGAAFHGRDRWDADAARHERLVDEGWTVVRVRAADLRSPDLIPRLRHRLDLASGRSGTVAGMRDRVGVTARR
jgi:very-short-patch-repair endonuclease